MNAFVLVRKNLFRRKLRACLMIATSSGLEGSK